MQTSSCLVLGGSERTVSGQGGPHPVCTGGSLPRRLHLLTELIELLLLQLCHDSVEGIDLKGRERSVSRGDSRSPRPQTPEAGAFGAAGTAAVTQARREGNRRADTSSIWRIRTDAA